MSIHVPENFYRQTITRAVTLVGATNIYVSAHPSPAEGYIAISPASTTLREIIYYTAKGTDSNGTYLTVTLANRGLGGTTAQTHVIGETVRMNVSAETIQEISDAIDQIVAAGAQDASTTTKGITKLSVAPVSATAPIAVGDNDPRLGYLVPTGGMMDFAGSKAVCIDNFNRPDSNSVGGLWTESDTNSILSIASNKLKSTGGNFTASINQDMGSVLTPLVFLDTAKYDYYVAATSGGAVTTRLTAPLIPQFSIRFKLNITYSSDVQFYFTLFGDGSYGNGYGMYTDINAGGSLKIYDAGGTVANLAGGPTSGSDYYYEITYLAGNAIEVRRWLASGSRPSTPTLSTGTRTRTNTSTGNKITIGFNNGTGNPTILLSELYIAYGNNAVIPMTVPTGFLECTGERVSRSTYATLYTAIGDVHGAGDGSTTFNVPQDWPLRLTPRIIKT